ncbi:MAG: hypothetical protein V7K57_21265 [Nostoc sp.]
MSARSLIKPEEPDPAKAMLCLPSLQTYGIYTSLAAAIIFVNESSSLST